MTSRTPVDIPKAGAMDFTEAVALVRSARTPDELFGGGRGATTYRRMARLLHPDTAPADRTATATDAFARLADLWARHQGRGGAELRTRRHRYTVGERFATGDLANLYRVRYDDHTALLKLPRQAGVNDLLHREATALATLRRDHDAWRLLAELDGLLEKLYGPRRFRRLVLPSAA